MPYYCETALNAIGSFPAEPVNSLTSLVPAVIGALALWQLWREGWGGRIALLLAGLTLLTGLGSTAWHALRTPLALTLDTAPGVLYFLVVVLAWPAMLGSRKLSAIVPAGLVAVAVLMPRDDRLLFIAAIVLALLATAVLLLVLTWQRCRPAFPPALAMVGAAAMALGFRSLDLQACDTIPIGTHFLWHIFLGLAAYAGIRMAVALANRPAEPVAD